MVFFFFSTELLFLVKEVFCFYYASFIQYNFIIGITIAFLTRPELYRYTELSQGKW